MQAHMLTLSAAGLLFLVSVFSPSVLVHACTLTSPSFLSTAGDGYCDTSANTAASCYDGGDCCSSTCVDNVYGCGVAGYDCKLFVAINITGGTVQCDTISVSNINYADCDGIYTRVSGNRFTKSNREMYYGSSCNQFYCCPKNGSCSCASGSYYGYITPPNVQCVNAFDGYTRPKPSQRNITNCVSGQSQISMDYSAIMNGISTVTVGSGASQSPFNLMGETVFPLLVNSNNDVQAAAARLGSGRIAGFGHSTFTSSAISLSPGTGPLLRNLIKWLANKPTTSTTTNTSVAFVSGSFSTLRTYLATFTGDFTIIQVSQASINTGVINADVLVLDASTSFATGNVTAVRQWVASGKGLLASATSWAFNYPVGFTDPVDFPGNWMFAGSGLVFCGACGTSSGTSWTISSTVPALTSTNSLCAARTVAAYVASNITLTSTELSTITGCATEAVTYVPFTSAQALSTSVLWDVANDLVTSIKPAYPSATNAVPASTNPLMLFENQILLQQPPQSMRAHPSSALFPGTPTGSTVASSTVTINGSYPVGWPQVFSYSGPNADVWRPVGLYAGPGAVITVTVPSSAVNSNLYVRIGSHTDSLVSKTSWNRYPQISLRFAIKSTSTQAANPWGGLIFITVPRGTNLGSVSVTVQGAYPSPLYVHGVTTPSTWAPQLNYTVPWAVFTTSKLMLNIPMSWAKVPAYPSELMTWWDSVLDAQADLAGISRTRARPEAISIDVQISAGYMHSGYPIMAPLDAVELTTLSTLKASGAWGYFHELGHNHQNWGWVFSGTTEVSVNLYTLYSYEAVLGFNWTQARPGWDRVGARRTYMTNWPASADFNSWKNDPFLALDTLYMLEEGFGWNMYKQFFYNFLQVDSSLYPSTDQGIRDLFVMNTSRIAGANLYPFFTAWAIPISASVNTTLVNEGIPIWVADPMMDWHGAPLVSASSIVLTNDTNGASGSVSLTVSFVRASAELSATYITAHVGFYKVFLGNASVPRAVELASRSLAQIGGSAGSRITTPIPVSFNTSPLYTQLTVVAASAYRNAWGSNHVAASTTGTDLVFSTSTVPTCSASGNFLPLRVVSRLFPTAYLNQTSICRLNL